MWNTHEAPAEASRSTSSSFQGAKSDKLWEHCVKALTRLVVNLNHPRNMFSGHALVPQESCSLEGKVQTVRPALRAKLV